MSLLRRLTELFRKDAGKFTVVSVDRDHIDGNVDVGAIEANRHYFRLWLSEMFLQREVDWFRTWYPVAHSLTVFQFGDQRIEIPHVAGPAHLQNVDEAHLEKFVTLDHQMTGLIPFNGGTVEIAVALLAMKGQDYIASVAKVLGDLSKLLVVPQLSKALDIALPIASGMQDLLGGQSGQVHLGVNRTFTGKSSTGSTEANELRSGYFAVIRGSETDYPKQSLWVKEGRLRTGETLGASTELTGVTYMLFRLQRESERDDWRSLTTISDAFKEALKYLSDGEEEKAEEAKRRTLFIVRNSPDLTAAHRAIVAKALKEEFDEAKKEGFGAVPMAMRSLDSVIERRGQSVDEALKDLPSLESLFK